VPKINETDKDQASQSFPCSIHSRQARPLPNIGTRRAHHLYAKLIIMYRVIFEHHPKEGQEAKFVAEWQKGSDIIQSYPGALGTKLFRITNPKILYAMADWESKDVRTKTVEAIVKDHGEEILHAHEQFVDSYEIIAEGELIAESVPGNQ